MSAADRWVRSNGRRRRAVPTETPANILSVPTAPLVTQGARSGIPRDPPLWLNEALHALVDEGRGRGRWDRII